MPCHGSGNLRRVGTYRQSMEAGPADAARGINLTGYYMGKLRTANKRLNRVILHSVARLRAATAESPKEAGPAGSKAVAAPMKTVS